jgi:hypothetical protein
MSVSAGGSPETIGTIDPGRIGGALPQSGNVDHREVTAMSLDVSVGRTHNDHPRRTFFHHYVEMLVVMMLSMVLLGGLVTGIFAIFGHSSVLHYTGLRAFVMATDMTVGMVIWMRFRGHGWAATLEMAGAMFLPYLLLVGPYAAGVISGDAFLFGMHVLMLPFMFLVMLRRYDEYAQKHGKHVAAHA